MNITDVRVRLVKNTDSKLKAITSIVFDDAFVVHDIKIIEGANDIFVVMPSRKTPAGEFKDIAHPLCAEMREELTKVILTAYRKAIATEA